MKIVNMTRALALAGTLLASLAAHGQHIYLNSYNPGSGRGQIRTVDGVTPVTSGIYSAQLFGSLSASADTNTFVALGPVMNTFLDGYIGENYDFSIPGATPGQTITYQIRVWNNGGGAFPTFAAAVTGNAQRGVSSGYETNVLGNAISEPPSFSQDITAFLDITLAGPIQAVRSAVTNAVEDNSVQITVQGAGVNATNFVLVGNAAHGSVSLVNNIATYTPNGNYNGFDAFSFVVHDGAGNTSAVETITVPVAYLNDVPFAFSNATSFAVGAAPAAVLAGDFYKDAGMDLVVANSLANNLTLLTGNKKGNAFTNFSTINVGNTPVALATADFNGDKIPDLVTANDVDGTVTVLLGTNYLGGFASNSFPAGGNAIALAVPDLDKDSRPDLVVVNSASNRVAVLSNNLNGTFASPVFYTAGTAPIAVASGDVSGDLKLDVVVANWGSHNVTVLRGLGTTVLTNPINYAVGSNPVALALADINGDKKLDIITANYGGMSLSVLTNSGSNFIALADILLDFAPKALAVADFNKDGKQDVVVTDEADNAVVMLPGDGAGAFAYYWYDPSIYLVVGTNPVALVVNDFNGDRNLDIVAANYDEDSVSVLLNNYILKAFKQAVNALEDAAHPITLTGTFGELDYTVTQSPTNGTLNLTSGTGTNGLVITYRPVTNFFGKDTIKYEVTDGVKTSKVETVAITVLPVNDRPSFLLEPFLTLGEDAGKVTFSNIVTGIVRGPTNEAKQTVKFLVTSNSNPGLFKVLPSLKPTTNNTGHLSFEMKANTNGLAKVTFVMQDSGKTLNGGVDTSLPRTITIQATNVNDAPSVGKLNVIAFSEDTNSVLASFGVTDQETAPNSLLYSLTVASTNALLFPNTGTNYFRFGGSGTNRTLTIRPATNQNGKATVVVAVNDGGAVTRVTNAITVNAVNDAPSFTLAETSILIIGTNGVSSTNTIATALSRGGGADENGQSLSFVVGNGNPSAFTTAPKVMVIGGTNGVLTFKAKPGFQGTVNVSLSLKDGGSAIAPNANQSAVTSFNIVIQP